MSCFFTEGVRLAVIKLEYGDDVLKGLERELKKAGITKGVILTGIGSSTSYHVHIVASGNMPPGNIYFKDDAPYDIVTMQGFVMNGRVHAHISLSDAVSAAQFGGHLEEGCRVLTFCAITIMETKEIEEIDKFSIPE